MPRAKTVRRPPPPPPGAATPGAGVASSTPPQQNKVPGARRSPPPPPAAANESSSNQANQTRPARSSSKRLSKVTKILTTISTAVGRRRSKLVASRAPPPPPGSDTNTTTQAPEHENTTTSTSPLHVNTIETKPAKRSSIASRAPPPPPSSTAWESVSERSTAAATEQEDVTTSLSLKEEHTSPSSEFAVANAATSRVAPSQVQPNVDDEVAASETHGSANDSTADGTSSADSSHIASSDNVTTAESENETMASDEQGTVVPPAAAEKGAGAAVPSDGNTSGSEELEASATAMAAVTPLPPSTQTIVNVSVVDNTVDSDADIDPIKLGEPALPQEQALVQGSDASDLEPLQMLQPLSVPHQQDHGPALNLLSIEPGPASPAAGSKFAVHPISPASPSKDDHHVAAHPTSRTSDLGPRSPPAGSKFEVHPESMASLVRFQSSESFPRTDSMGSVVSSHGGSFAEEHQSPGGSTAQDHRSPGGPFAQGDGSPEVRNNSEFVSQPRNETKSTTRQTPNIARGHAHTNHESASSLSSLERRLTIARKSQARIRRSSLANLYSVFQKIDDASDSRFSASSKQSKTAVPPFAATKATIEAFRNQESDLRGEICQQSFASRPEMYRKTILTKWLQTKWRLLQSLQVRKKRRKKRFQLAKWWEQRNTASSPLHRSARRTHRLVSKHFLPWNARQQSKPSNTRVGDQMQLSPKMRRLSASATFSNAVDITTSDTL